MRTYAARSSASAKHDDPPARAPQPAAAPPVLHHQFDRIPVSAGSRLTPRVMQLGGKGGGKKGGGTGGGGGGGGGKKVVPAPTPAPAEKTDEQLRAEAETFVDEQSKNHNPKSGASGTPKARREKWREKSIQEYMDKWRQNHDRNDRGGAGGGISAN